MGRSSMTVKNSEVSKMRHFGSSAELQKSHPQFSLQHQLSSLRRSQATTWTRDPTTPLRETLALTMTNQSDQIFHFVKQRLLPICNAKTTTSLIKYQPHILLIQL